MHSLITLYKECHVTISRKFSDVALVFSRLLALLSCVPLAAQDEQEKLIEKAKKYDLDTWRRKIAECNDKLYKNLTDQESGWQLLTGYDFLTVGSCDITTRQYPFFESFLEHFVLKDIKEMEDEHEDEMKESDNLWYLEFKKSWTLKPEWWSRNHDIVLIQLALKHGDDWKAYRKELTGEKASDFMMRLTDEQPEMMACIVAMIKPMVQVPDEVEEIPADVSAEMCLLAVFCVLGVVMESISATIDAEEMNEAWS